MVKITFQTVSAQKPEKETDEDKIIIPQADVSLRSFSLRRVLVCVLVCVLVSLLKDPCSVCSSDSNVMFMLHHRTASRDLRGLMCDFWHQIWQISGLVQ